MIKQCILAILFVVVGASVSAANEYMVIQQQVAQPVTVVQYVPYQIYVPQTAYVPVAQQYVVERPCSVLVQKPQGYWFPWTNFVPRPQVVYVPVRY